MVRPNESRADDRPGTRVVVLCAEDRPPDLSEVEARAEVRYVTADTLADELPGSDVLFVWDFTSRAVADAWPAPEAAPAWAHIASAGVDTMLFDGMHAADTVLTNSRGVFDTPIAEYVLGLVLAFAKDLPTTLAAQRERRWQHRDTEQVAGTHAVVVGTGPIGRAIARLLRAAGLRVTGVGRTARTGDPDFGTVYPSGETRTVLPGADWVVLAAPLTTQTAGMIDAAALAATPPHARLINVARGPLVDTDAVVEALREGRLAGAALDVFDTEPLPADSPLWTLPTAVVSPHMAGDFTGWLPALNKLFVANFLRWSRGEPLRHVVDKRLGYVPTGDPVH